jgi:hypothetical protein
VGGGLKTATTLRGCFWSCFSRTGTETGLPVRSAVLKMCRQVSSWVGDHQRIPAVDCFANFFFFFPLSLLPPGRAMFTTHEILPDGELPLLVEFP